MGAHFTSRERILDGVFDPSEPEILLYSREDGGRWRLTGTAFIILTQQVGQDHPNAFAGPLDNWHVHYSLCTGPRVSQGLFVQKGSEVEFVRATELESQPVAESEPNEFRQRAAFDLP